MLVTPLFAAIFALVYLVLSISVIKLRFKQQVSLGSAGDSELEKEIRIHANFAEYVPLCLLLLYFLETVTLSSRLSFWLGCVLLISRLSHVIGMRNGKDHLIFRQIGVLGTFFVIFVSALALIWIYLPINI